MITTTTTTVNIKATTWDKDSQDLFDYESKRIQEKSFEATTSANIFKNDDDVFVDNRLNSQATSLSAERSLVTVKQNNGSFNVCRAPPASENSSSQDNVWLVVKSVIPSNVHYRGHVINEGDVIKLGKVKLRVRELRASSILDSQQNNMLEDENIKQEKTEIKSEDAHPNFIQKHNVEELPQGQEFTCRVCLETENDQNNPLIAPCSCSGSVKHIHLDCLKHWFEVKRYHKVDVACETYIWNNLECELCHNSLPDIFVHENKEVHLVDLAKPLTPYLILETLPEKKEFRKVFYVASINQDNTENVLMLGRKSDCHIKVNDISVSRLHAMIKLVNGKFYLENGFSKFGTLLLLRDEIQLAKEYNLSVQVGRTVLTFELCTKEVLVLPKQEEKIQSQEIYGKKEESDLPKENIVSVRKLSSYSNESLICSNQDFKSSLNELCFSPNERNHIEGLKSISITDNLQNDLKHLDELIATMRGILGDRYVAGENSQPSVPESTLEIIRPRIYSLEENLIESRANIAENSRSGAI